MGCIKVRDFFFGVQCDAKAQRFVKLSERNRCISLKQHVALLKNRNKHGNKSLG